MPEISVIIPVYNVESFLPRCLDSLKAQTFSDWEAICIDDGSKDACPAILDSYSASDSRFVVVHRKNAGVSAARNEAMKLVRGKYVMFLDSDDFLHPQAMEICLTVAKRDSSDIAAFTYDRKYRTGTMLRHIFGLAEKSPAYDRYDPASVESFVTESIYEWTTEYSNPKDMDKRWAVKHCQPWRCFYKAEIVRNLTFIEGIIYEDFPWWGEVLLRVNRMSVLNLPLYFYYPNQKSYILSSNQDFRIESLKTAIAAAEKIYGNADPAKAEPWKRNFLTPFKDKLQKKEQHKR